MLLGGLFPRTDFSQLLHLRALADHYRLHQQEAAAMGQAFGPFDFLWLHFVEGDSHRHADSRQHEELPCHHVCSCVHVFVQQLTATLPEVQEFAVVERSFRLPSFYLLDVVTDFFRPPARF